MGEDGGWVIGIAAACWQAGRAATAVAGSAQRASRASRVLCSLYSEAAMGGTALSPGALTTRLACVNCVIFAGPSDPKEALRVWCAGC